MVQVDNSTFLGFFESDVIRNFYICDNIVNAGGPGYAIKSICFYTADGMPNIEYVSFCENIFDELIVEIRTSDEHLLSEAFAEIKRQRKKYKTTRIGSESQEPFNSNLFKKNFKIVKDYIAEHGVFAQFSRNAITTIDMPVNVSMQLVANEAKADYSDFDDDEWDGLASLVKYGNDKDLIFVIKEKDTVCGYIIANSSYKNIYDIANVFVAKKFRGKDYGRFLTVHFSEYCYDNNFIPHYGTAVSMYSETVAIKSGYVEVGRKHYVDVKVKLLAI